MSAGRGDRGRGRGRLAGGIGLVVLGLVAGCTQPQVPGEGPASAAAGAAPRPAPADLVIGPEQVAAAPAGQAIAAALQPGQRLRVELMGTPSAGYVWDVGQLPRAVTLVSRQTVADPQPSSGPMMVGRPERTVFVFAPASAEPGEIVLVYARPWERQAGAAPAQTVRIRVAVPLE